MSGAQYENNNAKSGAVVHAPSAAPQEVRPIDQFRSQLSTMTGELKNALPSHIKPEKFQRVVMTVVQQTPDLLVADRRSLFAACTKCAADGLIPDGREAALVLFSGRVQYMPMLAGIQKRVRNSGEISSINAHVIYEADEFVWRQGTDESLVHVPKWPGDRGKPVGAYAVAKFKDGSLPQFEVMSVDQIERVRNVSRAKSSGPWVQWWDEMARKTVFRRLSKWLPVDADVDTLMSRDDENEMAIPADQPAVPVSKLDVLEGSVLPKEPDGNE
jgi:recombination protein RecT